jgi:NADPH-dependent glutamate synthase beta subunit-like oxidoreductase/Pyruvate/2-oxoacid:ferredoxin oxidoreductase delta subunit
LLPEKVKENLCYVCGREPSLANKTGEWRFMTPEKGFRISPCRHSCLLEGEIPLWLDAVKKEDWADAWQIMSRYNPFPALTGHVCFHPCTDNCNRGQLDQEIDIPGVEKAVGEWRFKNYQPPAVPKAVKEEIAVVGSGPAGLSCAYYLSAAGYQVTVFERARQVGGMLALGIPEYRLPRSVLKQEIDILRQEGIRFVTDCLIGRDIQLSELYNDFSQVFLATGAWLPRQSAVEGADCQNVWNALDFLSLVNSDEAPALSDSVVVIGGGNAAIDSARTALRLSGVNHVTLIYRRSRAEMPAEQAEVEAAEREGIELIFNALPREFERKAEKIDSVLLDHCKTDRHGLKVDCSRSFKKDCGSVIMALGQEPDYSVFGSLEGAHRLFAGGDLASGPATVPEAIKAGRLAALSIIALNEGLPGPELAAPTGKPVAFEELNLEASFSLELLQSSTDPVSEAERCLGCGTCNSCGVCYLFCPDLAVERVSGYYELNLDYCKGCGICVRECPAQALVMEGGNL